MNTTDQLCTAPYAKAHRLRHSPAPAKYAGLPGWSCLYCGCDLVNLNPVATQFVGADYSSTPAVVLNTTCAGKQFLSEDLIRFAITQFNSLRS